MDEILEVLEQDGRMRPEEIAKITKRDLKTVKSAIKKYEKQGIILKYKAVINKDLVRDGENSVRALIEVSLLPEKDLGFDHIAERIYRFPEVASCYLISGSYDLLLIIEGKNIHTVSSFVAEKLAPMENVRGTSTHFMLKKYKEDGVILRHEDENKRIAISY